MDDEAFVVTAAVPATLINKLGRAIALVVATFEFYGMTINCKPGKTEALKAKMEKSKLVRNELTRTLNVKKRSKRPLRKTPTAELEVDVNGVSSYKHLG